MKERAKDFYQANRERLATAGSERMRSERAANPEKVRKREREYRSRNRERRRATDRRAAEKMRNSPDGRARLRANYKRWVERHPEEAKARSRARTAAHQARKRAQFVEEVDPRVVFERDEGHCGICYKKVDPENFHIDHVIPLSRGGPHSYDNVQLAHPFCNTSKGAKLQAA